MRRQGAIAVAAAVVVAVAVFLWVRSESPPLVTPDARPGTQVRVTGSVDGDAVSWSAPGADRPTGAGVLVRLEAGGEALVLAEDAAADDLRNDARDGRIDTEGEVIARVTPEQVVTYGFALDAFPPASPDRVLVLVR